MFTALPAIAVLAALGAVLAVEHHRSSVRDRGREAQKLAMAAAVNARGYLQDRFAILSAVAASPTVRGRDRGMRAYLTDAARSTRLDTLVIVDRRGRTVMSTAQPPGARPVDLSDREYVKHALAGRPGLSDALTSRLTRRPIVAFGYPITAPDGSRGGALVSSLRLDSVGVGLERLLFIENARATIIDGAGRVIGETRPGGDLVEAPAGYPVERMRAEGSGALDDVSTPAGERFLGFAALPRTGWLVVVDRPRSEVIGPLDRALQAELGALGLLAVVGVVLTFAIGRRLDRLDEQRDRALSEQRSIALQLQHSLLPELRVPQGLAAGAGYVPAQGAMTVGGDWFDLIDARTGIVALSVGDVAGHGLAAAATMGKLRSAARSAALEMASPAQALAQLDRFIQALESRPLATVVFAVLDVSSGRLRYAAAGHPPPLLLRAGGGSATYLEEGRSQLLGVGPTPTARPEASVTLEPGDTLVLYTDGVVERPEDPIDAGLAWLAGRVEAIGADPERLARELLASVPEPRRDDAAVLAVRLDAVRQPSSVAS